LLSSYFLRAIFFYTLPHSEHDIDYATLFIENSAHIWPGIQLTTDEFRLNPRALMDSLAYTTESLIRHDICLHVKLLNLEFYFIVFLNRFSLLGTSCTRTVRYICFELSKFTAYSSSSIDTSTCSYST